MKKRIEQPEQETGNDALLTEIRELKVNCFDVREEINRLLMIERQLKEALVTRLQQQAQNESSIG